jgi:hypothetical protein
VDARWPIESKFTPPLPAGRQTERAGILDQLTTTTQVILQTTICEKGRRV